MLSIYALFVHREIFDPLGRAGSLEQAMVARQMKVECIVLVEEFRAFTSTWRLADVAEAWEEYQPEASAFRLRILQHLDRVMALSNPALAHIRLKVAA